MKRILFSILLALAATPSIAADQAATKKQPIVVPQTISVAEALDELEVSVELLAQTIGPQLDPGPPAVTDVARIEALTVKVDSLILQLQ